MSCEQLWAQKAQPKSAEEHRAIDLVKAASARLAAAKAMSFTAIVDIEYPGKLGPPLAYPVRYDVAMARPDRLRILQSGGLNWGCDACRFQTR